MRQALHADTGRRVESLAQAHAISFDDVEGARAASSMALPRSYGYIFPMENALCSRAAKPLGWGEDLGVRRSPPEKYNIYF